MNMTTTFVALDVLSVKEAPTYGEDTKTIRMERVLIVKEGMESGRPSVDIQCVDAEGNKYLIFSTGAIFELIGNAVTCTAEGLRE